MVVVFLSAATGHNGSIKMPNLVFLALYTATNLLSASVLSVEYEMVTLTLEKNIAMEDKQGNASQGWHFSPNAFGKAALLYVGDI